MILHLRVKAGSKFNQLTKDAEGKWVMKVKAPPVEGQANEELIRFLSEVLKIPKSKISVIAGHTNPFKKIEIMSLSEEEVRIKMETHLQNSKPL
ncbi:MAG TPA: DUF167 domain-containing protein [Chitinophagales bacterium]|nr:DUF167 domain-containing protein [Chitinophagales bacterium]